MYVWHTNAFDDTFCSILEQKSRESLRNKNCRIIIASGLRKWGKMLTTGVCERGVDGANYLTALEERGLCHDPDTLVFPIDFKRRSSKDPISGIIV